jgi:hypothetical protein
MDALGESEFRTEPETSVYRPVEATLVSPRVYLVA